MDLPIIPTPIAPRWVWMEEVTFSHIPIATIITAYMVLAPIFEYIGYRRQDLRFDRLAKGFIYFAMILFSPGAALGTGIPMIIIGLYPEFWARWANIFFWPLIVQFVLFNLEVLFLFFYYYLVWDKMMNQKRRHILYGVIAMVIGLLIQVVWDAIGSYMLTPGGVPFPAVNEAIGWSAKAFFNPSFPYLFFHRFFGNLSYVMLLTGGVYALRNLYNKQEKERQYYRFAMDICFTLGFIAFFAQPLIGWAYSMNLQEHAPVAFHAIMGGHGLVYFYPKMISIAVFLLIGGIYIFIRYRKSFIPLVLVTLAIASLYIVLIKHPPLRWLGGGIAWRTTSTLVLLGFIALLWFLRQKEYNFSFRGWQWFIFVAGMASVVTFFMGGNARERIRSPHSVYNQLEKPEVLPYEADRFLVYERCLGCHASPKDLKLKDGGDWAERVAVERQREEVELNDEEAGRIVHYLKEYHQ